MQLNLESLVATNISEVGRVPLNRLQKKVGTLILTSLLEDLGWVPLVEIGLVLFRAIHISRG